MRTLTRAFLGVLCLTALWALLADQTQVAAQSKGRTVAGVASEIDRLVQVRLTEKKIPVSPLADDAEFLRRVTLDITGRVPKMERTVAFLNDTDPDKRRKLIDELLADPEYGEHFGLTWYHLMIHQTDDNKGLLSDDFQEWLAGRFNKNVGWNKIVGEILTAEGQRDKNPAVNFFLTHVGPDRQPEDNRLAAATSHLFLGVKLECCECHNHPFSTLKQTDFWGIAAFFTHTHGDSTSKKDTKAGTIPAISEGVAMGKAAKLEKKGTAAPPGFIVIPDTGGKTAKARFLLGEEPTLANKMVYRRTLASWVTDAKNPYFAKAAVNRMWAHFFGRGIVTPVDDMRPESKTNHPELIKLLADDFVASGFDLKHLIRCICNSQAYQRSSKPLPGNKEDDELFSHAVTRMMTADVLFDSLAVVLEHSPAGPKDKGGGKKVGGGPREQFRKFFHTEADDDVSAAAEYAHGIPQALRLMNSGQMNNVGPAVQRFVKEGGGPPKVIESIYLTVLSRRPTDAETKRMVKYVAAADAPGRGYADVFWALVNSSEFIFNH